MPRQARLVPLASQVEGGKHGEGLRAKGGGGGVGKQMRGGVGADSVLQTVKEEGKRRDKIIIVFVCHE